MVRKKLRLMKLLPIVMLVFGWLLAASLLMGESDEDRQNKLILQAEQFCEDKLYMRAVNVLQSAVTEYRTEQNPEIQKRILAIYAQSGKWEEYYELVEDRIEEGYATEQEYMELAQRYVDEEMPQKAIPVMQKGMKIYGKDSFIELYNSVAYEAAQKDVNMKVLSFMGTDGNVPYQDGELWGYMTSDGKAYLAAAYQEALPFSNGYAIVKTEGRYVLIDGKGDWYAVDKTGADKVTGFSGNYAAAEKDGAAALYTRTFSPVTEFVYEKLIINSNGLVFAQKDGKWGILDGTGKTVVDFVYEDIAVNSRGEVFSDGYAMVKDAEGYLVINEEGRALSDARYADAKGIEGGLAAVADENGKWGFTDGVGEMVIPCQYTDAKSFSGDLAPVCFGGKWGYITSNNQMVIEASYDEAEPFYQGRALIKNNDVFHILVLKYRDLL